MRPRERRDGGQNDLFKARLDQIVDMNHPLAKLGRTVDWGLLEKSFGAVYSDGPGQPPLPTRLTAGIAILKHMHDLSDEVLCERCSPSSQQIDHIPPESPRNQQSSRTTCWRSSFNRLPPGPIPCGRTWQSRARRSRRKRR